MSLYDGSNVTTDRNTGTRNEYYLNAAKQAAMKAINEGPYKLLGNYADLFAASTQNNNDESMFQLQFQAGASSGLAQSMTRFLAWSTQVNQGNSWGGSTYCSWDLWEELKQYKDETLDNSIVDDAIRRHYSVASYGEAYPELSTDPEKPYIYGETESAGSQGANIKKYVIGTNAVNGFAVNNVWVTLNGDTPVEKADESVRNTITLYKSDSNKLVYKFTIRAAAPSISSCDNTLPKAGETVTVYGTNLQETTKVTLPGGIEITSGIISDEDGKWYSFTMPDGVTEAGSITSEGANGTAVTPAYFNDDWSRMFSIIPETTLASNLALQFDIYCPEPWDESGQLEFSLQNNLSNYGWNSDCTKFSAQYKNTAAVWIPWLNDDGTHQAFTTGQRWQTITLPLSKFGNYNPETAKSDADKAAAATLRQMSDDRNAGSYRNFLFLFVNGDIKTEEGVTPVLNYPAKLFTQKIYIDNIRVVNTTAIKVNDFDDNEQ